MKKKSRLSESWKDVFTFSASEKRGIYVLVIIIMLLTGAIWVYRYYPPSFPKQDYSAFEKEVNEFFAEQKKQDSLNAILLAEKKDFSQRADSLWRTTHHARDSLWKNYPEKNFQKEKTSLTYFDFDPNDLPAENWKQLGLNDGQIRVINNYQSKGGKFRKKEDLKKIHVISENDYARLEPYIKIKEQPIDTEKHFEKKTFTPERKNAAAKIDVGIADTIELKAIRGVGPSRARGIFKYRQILGGYYSINQLREVYGIDSAAYAEIAEQVFIKDTTNIRKININTTTSEQLGAHPYIRKKLAELIVSYRREHGNFSSIAALKRMPLVNDDLYSKLAPYLKAE
ncbi:MAG TPA: helix-hairpin-helix domain-containing protein [Bacteroidia bacterium]|nr:helix-hairpin-helix domain-containing protein [Bacteroidia bacterium]